MPESDAGPEIIRVPQDEATIASALERASAGDMVLLSPGEYREQVEIDTADVTLRGQSRDGVIIDGGGLAPYGVFVSADGARVQNLTVRATTFYGVLVSGMHDDSGPLAHGGPGYVELDPAEFPPVERFAVQNVTVYNNGLYGIYAFNARHGVIENSYASGSADSGFYVGQCEDCDIIVRGNVAEGNAIGFENANASDSVTIAGNRFSSNRIGMTLISNYQEAFAPQRANLVTGNLIADNDNPQSPSHALGGFGIGIGIDGARQNVFNANLVTGHPASGLLLTNTEDLAATGNTFEDQFTDNAVDAVNRSATRAPASGNCLDLGPDPITSPPDLAESGCEGQPNATGSEWQPLSPPPGVDFMTLPAPPPQPPLQDVEALPPALPATAGEHPHSSPPPARDLFADLVNR